VYVELAHATARLVLETTEIMNRFRTADMLRGLRGSPSPVNETWKSLLDFLTGAFSSSVPLVVE
jgi:hypothetical protein